MWGHPPYPGVMGEGSLVGGAAFGAPIDEAAVLLGGVAKGYAIAIAHRCWGSATGV